MLKFKESSIYTIPYKVFNTQMTCAFDTILGSMFVLYDSETTQNKALTSAG
jgi:hypothetical protein